MKSAAGLMSRLFCFGENRCRWDAVYFTLTLDYIIRDYLR